METGGFTHCTVIYIQSDCYTWRGKRYFPKISIQKELPASKRRRWDNTVCNSMGIRSQAGKRRIV